MESFAKFIKFFYDLQMKHIVYLEKQRKKGKSSGDKIAICKASAAIGRIDPLCIFCAKPQSNVL